MVLLFFLPLRIVRTVVRTIARGAMEKDKPKLPINYKRIYYQNTAKKYRRCGVICSKILSLIADFYFRFDIAYGGN